MLIFSDIVSAVRILSIIPIPRIKEPANLSGSLLWFPYIGLLLGFFVYIFYYLGHFFIPDKIGFVAVFSLLFITFITGAIHIDGLCDFFDGFGGGKDKESIIKIMKDSRIGAFGSTALCFNIILKVLFWKHYYVIDKWSIIVLSLTIARILQSYLIILSARAHATSLISMFSNCSGGYKTLIILNSVLLFVTGLKFYPLMLLITSISTGFIVLYFIRFLAYRKINGITGDCVGALNEISEVMILFVALFFI